MLTTLFPAVCAAISLAALLVVLVRNRRPAAILSGPVPAGPNFETELRTDLSNLIARVARLESECRESVGGPVRAGINLDKRRQAIRQYKQGQTPEVIAKSLDLTKAEVVLLLKVQQIVAR